MNDDEIIKLYNERNEQAVTETERKYRALCFGIAKNILESPEDSEEVLNDALLAVWNSIPPAAPDSLKAFVCKITRNQALTRLKFNTRKKRAAGYSLSLDELEEAIPDKRVSGTDDELSAALNGFLGTLEARERAIFVRKYWYFDSVKQIAGYFSYSESKINSILYRTRQKLRAYLKKEGIYL